MDMQEDKKNDISALCKARIVEGGNNDKYPLCSEQAV